MLYNRKWLSEGEEFPPKNEASRIEQYKNNAEHFDMNTFKEFSTLASRIIQNWEDYINFDIILNYQRLITIKLADMVCGAFPSINAKDNTQDEIIQTVRDATDFDTKLYSAVIDFSRFGVALFRIFTDEETEKGQFTCWTPAQWFPVFFNDGTNRIKEHILAWRVNMGDDIIPKWHLRVQIHPTKGGSYISQLYSMDNNGTHMGKLVSSKTKSTGGYPCLVQCAVNIPTSTNPYGTSDYAIINKLVKKGSERLKQIGLILDQHADPSMCGPDSLLEPDDHGELVLKIKKFYALGPDEVEPRYITWDGKLDAAFKELEIILNQLYILSEMGNAFLGNTDGNGQAISGTAMRYKMISPLCKARRVCNSLSLPLKKLMSLLLKYEDVELDYKDISIKWEDSLPKDPREQAELLRLQTGSPQIVPLEIALKEQFDMTDVEAQAWIKMIEKDQQMYQTDNDTDINPRKKGSTLATTGGTENATGTQNKKQV